MTRLHHSTRSQRIDAFIARLVQLARERRKLWKERFRAQRTDAKKRGVEFQLSFPQWLRIWQRSGHAHERGPRRGQYVMARYKDRGPYAVGNVDIITGRENLRYKRTTRTRSRMSVAAKRKFAKGYKHPRPMLGHHHNAEAREKISASLQRKWKDKTHPWLTRQTTQ